MPGSRGERMAIGRIGSPRGLHGDLRVHSYSGEVAHFRNLVEVDLEHENPGVAGVVAKGVAGGTARGTARGTAPGRAPSTEVRDAPRSLHVRVARVSTESGQLSMAFAGYESPEAARSLTGMDIVVPKDKAAPLRDNEWYVDDLVGLGLFDGDSEVARVVSVLEGGPDPWLEVELPGGRRALVPFRGEFVGEVRPSEGRIELRAPWLLDP